jgi:hypothetical protein
MCVDDSPGEMVNTVGNRCDNTKFVYVLIKQLKFKIRLKQEKIMCVVECNWYTPCKVS